jgi:hypothetical protein
VIWADGYLLDVRAPVDGVDADVADRVISLLDGDPVPAGGGVVPEGLGRRRVVVGGPRPDLSEPAALGSALGLRPAAGPALPRGTGPSGRRAPQRRAGTPARARRTGTGALLDLRLRAGEGVGAVLALSLLSQARQARRMTAATD